MARVTKIERTRLERNSVHAPVECTYTVFDNADGNKYLQFDTYGSPRRAIQGKKSQSIQFDKESAKVVFEILKSEYHF